MTDCERLPTCAFFKEYEDDEDKRLALEGFIRIYCKGDKQDHCIRKRVGTGLN
jgi:hypothetical protein